MGNYISCTLASPIGKAPCRATKVIFPSGELRHIYKPTKAAELMLERDAEFLHCQHQISANREKIFCSERRRRSVNWKCVRVFPMNRVNSLVKPTDMGALLLVANSSAKMIACVGVRILPDSGGDMQSSEKSAALPKLNLDDIEEFTTPEFKHRMSIPR
ncbi:hypothetical protein ACS0TY_018162 [Phlomoides rotata]